MSQYRLERIEAILRDHGMHEPACPTRHTEKAQRGSTMYFVPAQCACWLSRPPEEAL